MVSTKKRTVFVTVGTTKFEELIRAVDTDEFIQLLKSKGFDSMTVQIGRGDYKPTHSGPQDGFICDFYKIKPSLAPDVESAALVISHGGAGTIMEVMRAKKPLVVVINELLMDNHQVELADALESRGHLVSTSPKDLPALIEGAKLDALKPYPASDQSLFPRIVDEEMGFAR